MKRTRTEIWQDFAWRARCEHPDHVTTPPEACLKCSQRGGSDDG